MKQVNYDTIDRIGRLDRVVIGQHNYVKTQQMAEFTQDTGEGTIILEHHKWDRYIETHQVIRDNNYIKTQQIGQIRQDTTDRRST